jgi:hypothetical protein
MASSDGGVTAVSWRDSWWLGGHSLATSTWRAVSSGGGMIVLAEQCSITSAWIAYHEKHLDDVLLLDEDEQKLLGALIAISTGVEDLDKLGVPANVGRRLLACYDGLGED